MSLLSFLVFIAQGGFLRRGYSQKSPDDATFLELLSRILVEQQLCPSELSVVLEQGIGLNWEDTYDFVNPFGDRRDGIFNSVWTFDLDKDVLFLEKRDRCSSTSLELARQRLLTMDDFKQLSSATQTPPGEQTLPGPYWQPNISPLPRARAFAGHILRDFGFKWRHIIRRQINATTFMKLAYAIIWISRMDFTILERTGFEHVCSGGPYVKLTDLPSWETPQATTVQVGSSWFALARDVLKGLEMIRSHMSTNQSLGCSTTHVVTYAILTPRQIILCNASGNELVWTKSETLFDNDTLSNSAIDMIMWATNTTSTEPQPNSMNRLPIEIQDKILSFTTISFVASAKLGCELGLGSPFTWTDGDVKIGIEEAKRHRSETSPVESLIVFNGVMSGLSYKRERGYPLVHATHTKKLVPS
ncbi:hypothetical protein QQS21_002473 [Conoideocrella luteorostrata]|uniref:Uncharacterized protein n=1 Tax=Conoideocrella luteorostrata TaxID=1105319 RepID=A0AAJ0CW27_9HYPO|nr:hypothetical protein QQS21_002473 [Conoideocrella luteorostrata]